MLRPTEFSRSIGNNILRLRKAKGWSQKECAIRAGWKGKYGQGRVANYENGVRVADHEAARDLAHAFNVPVSKILRLPPVGRIRYTLVPLFDFESLHMMRKKKPALIQWPSVTRVSGHAQVTIVPDDSMAPDFKAGELLLVDATLTPQHGDYVIAVINGEPALRRYTSKKLKVLRASDSVINYDPATTPIIAIVISSVKNHR